MALNVRHPLAGARPGRQHRGVSSVLERSGGLLLLRGLVRGEPNAAMVAIDDVFGAVRVSITDVRFFSGLQATLSFEGPSEAMQPLLAGLTSAGVELDEPSRLGAEEASQLERPVAGMLVVVFLQGDPNLRHDVPAVPG